MEDLPGGPFLIFLLVMMTGILDGRYIITMTSISPITLSIVTHKQQAHTQTPELRFLKAWATSVQ